MPLGGLLGYDFISRFVIAIDYGKQTITFYPASYRYRGKGCGTILHAGTATLHEGEHHGKGETIQALFILDVGAADTLTLTTPFVKEHNLLSCWARSGPTRELWQDRKKNSLAEPRSEVWLTGWRLVASSSTISR